MSDFNVEEILKNGEIGKVRLSDLTQVPEGEFYKYHVIAAKNIRKIITQNYPELIMVKVSGHLNLGYTTIKVSLICDKVSENENENLKKVKDEINGFIQLFCDEKYVYSEKHKRNFKEDNINDFNQKYGSASHLYCTIERCFSNEEKQQYLKKEINHLKNFLGKTSDQQKNKKRL